MNKSYSSRVAFALVSLGACASEAAARLGKRHEVAAPEIDGPAGAAAMALLVSAGILVYRRYKK